MLLYWPMLLGGLVLETQDYFCKGVLGPRRVMTARDGASYPPLHADSSTHSYLAAEGKPNTVTEWKTGLLLSFCGGVDKVDLVVIIQ